MLRVFIEAISGPGQGNRIPVGQNQVLTIGRTEWSDICIPNDPQISGKHFQIENTGTEVRIADLNSTNGTMVNGQFVKQATLSPGDQVVAGSTTFTVHIELPSAGGIEQPARSPSESLQVPGGPGGGYFPPAPGATPAAGYPPIVSHNAGGTNAGGTNAGSHPTPSFPTSPVAPSGSGGFQSPIFVPVQTPAVSGAPAGAVPATGGPPPQGQTPFATPIQLEPGPAPLREPVPTTPQAGVGPLVGGGGSPAAPAAFAGPSSPIASPIVVAEPPSAAPARPQIVLDERRQIAAAETPDARQFQKTELPNGLVLLEGPPPANSEQPGASRVAMLLAQVGVMPLIAHFAKASLPLPLDVSGKPLFHWLPAESAREFGPLIIAPRPENAHLAMLDLLWGQDCVMAVCGSDLAELETHLLDLIQFNPVGFRRSNTLFGYCWPMSFLQLCKSVQPDVAAEIFSDAVQFVFCESASQPGAWCVVGRPGLESTLQQIGFQEKR